MEFVAKQRQKGCKINYLQLFENWASSGSNYTLNDLFIDVEQLGAYQDFINRKNNLNKRGLL